MIIGRKEKKTIREKKHKWKSEEKMVRTSRKDKKKWKQIEIKKK